MENNNPENADPTKEEREIMRGFAKNSLTHNYIINLASVGFGQAKEGEVSPYGTILSNLYKTTTDNAPDQLAWEKIYRDNLQSNGGGVSKQGSIDNAKKDVLLSLQNITVSDVFELLGGDKTIPTQEYVNQYVGDLPQEIKEIVIKTYIRSMVNQRAEVALSGERKAMIGGLEQIFQEGNTPNPTD